MSRLLGKEKARRQRTLKTEKNRLKNQLSSLLKHKKLTYKSMTKIRNKNICHLSAAGHSIYAKFGMSRHSLRKYTNAGYLPGMIQSSW